MKEKGFMIDRNGVFTSFGIHGQAETVESGHQRSFEQEIVDTPYFHSLNLPYDKSKNVYSNALILSWKEGIILGFNRQVTPFSLTQIEIYVPEHPTQEQLDILDIKKEQLDIMSTTKLTEFHAENYIDVTEYTSCKDYISNKRDNSKVGYQR